MFVNIVGDFDDGDIEREIPKDVVILELYIDWLVVIRSLEESFWFLPLWLFNIPSFFKKIYAE